MATRSRAAADDLEQLQRLEKAFFPANPPHVLDWQQQQQQQQQQAQVTPSRIHNLPHGALLPPLDTEVDPALSKAAQLQAADMEAHWNLSPDKNVFVLKAPPFSASPTLSQETTYTWAKAAQRPSAAAQQGNTHARQHNPYATTMDALPATRHLGPKSHPAQQLQLSMLTGTDAELAASMEAQLVRFLNSTGGGNGSSKARLDLSPPRVFRPVNARVPAPRPTHPSLMGALQRPASADVPAQIQLQSRQALHSAGQEMTFTQGAGMAPVAGMGTSTTRAEAFAGGKAGLRQAADAHQGNSGQRGHVSTGLAELFTEQQTDRRQVQRMAEWLDAAVEQLWTDATPDITDLSLRAAFAGNTARAGASNASNVGNPTQAQAAGGLFVGPQVLQKQLSISAVLASMNGSGIVAAQPESGPKKGSLAAHFATFVAHSLSAQADVGGAAWATSHHLWTSLLQVVGVVAGVLVRHVGRSVWEEGALLAALWNLHTGLLDAGMSAAHARAAAAENDADELRDQVRRLSPLLDWERAATSELEQLKEQLAATQATAQLASAERDALLRENDKIILHYRQELRNQRRDARITSWRLVKKLKNQQEQLVLLQRDRQQLINAVSFTKGQASSIMTMVHGVNTHFSALAKEGSRGLGDDMVGLAAIETGLRDMVHTAHRVVAANKEAEEAAYNIEEAVTAVQAADETGADDLVQAVLAEGDPHQHDEPHAATDLPPGIQQDMPAPLSPTTKITPRVGSQGGMEGAGSTATAAGFKARRPAALRAQQLAAEDYDSMSPASRAALDFLNGKRRGVKLLPDDAATASQSTAPPVEGVLEAQVAQEADTDEPAAASDTMQDAATTTAAAAGRVKGSPSHPASPARKLPQIELPAVPGGSPRPRLQSGQTTQRSDISAAVEVLPADPTSTAAAALPMDTAATTAAGPAYELVTKDAETQTEAEDMTPDIAESHTSEYASEVPSSQQSSRPSSQPVAHEPRSPMQTIVDEVDEQQAALLAEAADTLGIHLDSHTHAATSPSGKHGGKSPKHKGSKGGKLRSKVSGSSEAASDAGPGQLLTPRTAAGIDQLVAGVQSKLEELQGELAQKTSALEAAEQKATQLVDDLQERSREVDLARQQADMSSGKYLLLVNRLRDLGLDPDRLKLPTPRVVPSPTPDADGTAGETTAPSDMEEHDSKPHKHHPEKKKKKAANKSKSKHGAKTTATDRNSPERLDRSNSPAPSELPHRKPKSMKKLASLADTVTSSIRPSPAMSPEPGDTAKTAAAGPWPGKAAPTAFLLGKDRQTEKKCEQPGNERLAEAVTKHAGIRARTLDWLLKLIDGIYRGKMSSDEMRSKMVPALEPLPLVDYMFQHLAGVYGTRDLVNQYAAQLVATINTYIQADHRVALFQKLLMETWPPVALVVFLDGLRRLGEPARLPCCDFPPDWSAAKKGGVPLLDVRKCLWVSDKVLMKRHTRTAYSFAATLAIKGEAITDAELAQYFVAPGYYGPDVAHMRDYEKSRAEFRKIPITTFLEALVDEYLRCEEVYMDVLPGIFKKWDRDVDHFLKQQDVAKLFEFMSQQGVVMEDHTKDAETFWRMALAFENEQIASGLANVPSTTAAGIGTLSRITATEVGNTPNSLAQSMLGVQAFMRAAMKCDLLRAYVRLHKTPPAKLRIQNSDEEQARILLLLLINRHWQLHGTCIKEYFPVHASAQTGLQAQCDSMEHEKDGARKALALHGLLKMMIGLRLDRLVTQLSPDNLAASVDPDFEDSLTRLTQAVKVLYGANIIVAEELLQDNSVTLSPVAAMQRQKQIGQVCSLYNSIRGMMNQYALNFLGKHATVQYWVQRWRNKAHQQASRAAARASPFGSYSPEPLQSTTEQVPVIGGTLVLGNPVHIPTIVPPLPLGVLQAR